MTARKLIAPAAALATAATLAAATLPAAVAAPKGATVAVKDNRFAPAAVTVRKGATVTWAWRGKAAHNVHVNSGPTRFTSPNKLSGSWSRRLTKKGRYAIVCTIHPGMKMALTVR
jgi:plastocyanin